MCVRPYIKLYAGTFYAGASTLRGAARRRECIRQAADSTGYSTSSASTKFRPACSNHASEPAVFTSYAGSEGSSACSEGSSACPEGSSAGSANNLG